MSKWCEYIQEVSVGCYDIQSQMRNCEIGFVDDFDKRYVCNYLTLKLQMENLAVDSIYIL